MTAFIEIRPKSNKGGHIYLNEVANVNEAKNWFELNMDFIEKQSKRRSIESVWMYVKDNYQVVYHTTK